MNSAADGVVVAGRLDAAQCADGPGVPRPGRRDGHAGLQPAGVHLQRRPGRPAQDPEAADGLVGKLRLVGRRPPPPGHLRLFRLRPDLRDRAGAVALDQLLRPPRVIVDNDADQALVERYRNGDRAAFTELVVRYQRPIYNAAFWVLRKAEDASDITQDRFPQGRGAARRIRSALQVLQLDLPDRGQRVAQPAAPQRAGGSARRRRRAPGPERDTRIAGQRGRGREADPERADEHVDQRSDRADAAPLFRVQLPGDRRRSSTSTKRP